MATPKGKLKTGKKISANFRSPVFAKKPAQKYGQKQTAVKKFAPPKKANMDIVVKRSIYSKAARAAVLADAAARQKLIEMGGENTIDVIREFDKDMSDEELAKKTGIKPSEVRVVLNRLHNRGVFAYTRVRDRDSGWYSYIWRMDEARLRDVGCGNSGGGEVTFVRSKEGYHCPQCGGGQIVEFEEAVDMQFKCGCGNSLEFVDARRVPKE